MPLGFRNYETMRLSYLPMLNSWCFNCYCRGDQFFLHVPFRFLGLFWSSWCPQRRHNMSVHDMICHYYYYHIISHPNCWKQSWHHTFDWTNVHPNCEWSMVIHPWLNLITHPWLSHRHVLHNLLVQLESNAMGSHEPTLLELRTQAGFKSGYLLCFGILDGIDVLFKRHFPKRKT